MGAIQKIQGFVLKKKNLLHDDFLIIIFTKELGKISAMVKGARSFSSRRGAHLQTGNLVKARLSEYHEILYIQSTDLVSAFSNVRTQEKMNAVYLFLYILDKLLPERVEEPDIYRIFMHFFKDLSANDADSQMILQTYLQYVLQILGYIEEAMVLSELIARVEEIIDEKLPAHVIM